MCFYVLSVVSASSFLIPYLKLGSVILVSKPRIEERAQSLSTHHWPRSSGPSQVFTRPSTRPSSSYNRSMHPGPAQSTGGRTGRNSSGSPSGCHRLSQITLTKMGSQDVFLELFDAPWLACLLMLLSREAQLTAQHHGPVMGLL